LLSLHRTVLKIKVFGLHWFVINMLPPKVPHENEKPCKIFEPLNILYGFFMSLKNLGGGGAYLCPLKNRSPKTFIFKSEGAVIDAIGALEQCS
jgi:hypothetical protein